MNIAFTLGENIGQLVHNVAWENFLNFEPDKAIDIFTESFVGMSPGLAKKLVVGDYICTYKDDGEVLMKEKGALTQEELKGYPDFDKKEILRRVTKFINVRDENEHARLYFDELRYDVLNYININKTINVEKEEEGVFGTQYVDESFPIRKLLKYYFENNDFPDDFEITDCDQRSQDILGQTMHLINFCEKLKDNFSKIKHTIEFAIDAYKLEGDEKIDWLHLINGVELMVEDSQDWLQYVKDLCINSPEAWQENRKDELQTYLDNAKNIEESLKSFGPVDPSEKWDAGFIAPDGNFFGLNGVTANLLHINLADAIIEYYGLEEEASKEEFGRDFFLLGKKGFIKITGVHVYYEGYDEILGKKVVPITSKQIDTLKKYGRNYTQLLFGPENVPFTVEIFETLDEFNKSEILRNDL